MKVQKENTNMSHSSTCCHYSKTILPPIREIIIKESTYLVTVFISYVKLVNGMNQWKIKAPKAKPLMTWRAEPSMWWRSKILKESGHGPD